jgi:hypothetical protein
MEHSPAARNSNHHRQKIQADCRPVRLISFKRYILYRLTIYCHQKHWQAVLWHGPRSECPSRGQSAIARPFAPMQGRTGEIMRFYVGDAVYNKTTGERGHVVRMIDAKQYVVSVDPDPKSGVTPAVTLSAIPKARQREALWLRSQITRKPEKIVPMRRRF